MLPLPSAVRGARPRGAAHGPRCTAYRYNAGQILTAREGILLQELKGTCALITGATSGIGRDIAEHFAASGARLMLTGRNRGAGAELAARLGAHLINNAGITHPGSILEKDG